MIKSSTTPDFWNAFSTLPLELKTRAKVAFQLWRNNPRHPSLQFKKVGNVWSVRIGGGYRALFLLEEDTYFWFWIGDHKDYQRLISHL